MYQWFFNLDDCTFKAPCNKYRKVHFFNVTTTFRCVKSARIRSYSGPHFSHIFPQFGLNGVILVRIFLTFSLIRTEYEEICFPYSVRMRENAEKMRTRITPNTDTFYVVFVNLWNSQHKMKPQINLQLPNGVPTHMFCFPEQYGGTKKRYSSHKLVVTRSIYSIRTQLTMGVLHLISWMTSF